MAHTDGPARLAEAIVARRVALDLRTAKELAEAASLSPRLLGDIENARRESYSKATLWALDKALYWESGSAQAILDGGEPTPIPTTPKTDTKPETATASTHFTKTLLGDLADALTAPEIAEVEAVAKAAGLQRAREIISTRPAPAPTLAAVNEDDDALPDFTLLAARTVTHRPGWDAASAHYTTGEESQD